jgi:K(+)-stimulated pyrophosphate-energized sodium pump
MDLKSSLSRLGAWAARLLALGLFALPTLALASEADIKLPSHAAREKISFNFFGQTLTGEQILMGGMIVSALGVLFGLLMYYRLKKLPAHQSMLDISTLIYGTCRTYLIQQGKLLLLLEILIGGAMVYYFGFLRQMPASHVALIIMWSLIGIAGSFAVAWFGMLINNVANSRMAFAALKANPKDLHEIPTKSGMSIGVLLISVELLVMLIVLQFVSPDLAGVCFIGFAIGESLGASVLRICGGIFTKIADIGSDMMKVIFKIKEDDARNPGVIADCAGDNAGDSVGPTADGFETYGVTGVALITFIVLAVAPEFQWQLIVWIFAMRVLMIFTSVGAWKINAVFAGIWLKGKHASFEHPLTALVWLTSILSILVTFVISYTLLAGTSLGPIWWKLAVIISCGTLSAAIIPELTRMFTSTKSKHCREIVDASREGGTGLTILSGIVAGNFSAFWKGLAIIALMFIAYLSGADIGSDIMKFPAVFAFGLVAFGMLGMGPVTIAVDSYGPVADNAQSVFELSTIEQIPNIHQEVEKDFGFKPNFPEGKRLLEENDGAGNTFKATAKPVLIGTAVVGATTMIFSLILMLQKHFTADPNTSETVKKLWENFGSLSIIDPHVILGLIAGGAVIYWFSGASMQAVTTGAYRAVDFIKKNMKLSETTKASQQDSNKVVEICTRYAQYGMINIFMVIFALTIAFASFHPVFFVSYLISIAVFGLFAAIYMANAGGCWDNAKKIVEVELREKGTPLHDSTVIGDIVGDPFKDTSSVSLNPIIKFTTLFGILAVEIAVSSAEIPRMIVGVVALLIGLFFVWRSFYGMRIASGNG